MKKTIALLLSGIFLPLFASAQVTLDYCLDRAGKNYPLIHKYDLVAKTTDLSLSDINKGWLPRINVYGQVTIQNVVPEFPSSLKDILAKLGQDYKGLGYFQYKVGVDVSQTIWDGGASKAQREIERTSSAEQQAALSVRMYAVREKVMNLYFGILLMDEQIAQVENTIALLKANHTLMQSMKTNGVAMQSDVDMVEAQLLTMTQQLTGARSAAKSYKDVLAVYIGESIDGKSLVKPEATMPANLDSNRPELALFNAQNRHNNALDAAINSSVMPRIGFFAQSWYGYPGINYFESMMKRDPSFNLIAGVKISWNVDAFYTKKNSRHKLALAGEGIENDREVFLYNTRLQTAAQTQEIDGIRSVMADDERIVTLRASVRQAAESQLKNGVIDATALLSKITDENQALLTARYHEIQLLQNIYKLKNTLNR